jgi:TatD DNase family protein
MKINACSVAVDSKSSLRTLQLFDSSTHDVVTRFVGIHPEFAGADDISEFIKFFNNNHELIDGIGEIGLDLAYAGDSKISYEKQKEVFYAMLALSEATKKPVSIHSRGSLDEILAALNSYNIGKVLLHWFSGSKKQLQKSMDMGLYVGYGPLLVYSAEKQILLKNTGLDQFLVETDGPVRYSRCFKGLTSMSSSFLISVINAAACTLGRTYYETRDLVRKNSENFLGNRTE